MFYDPDVKGDHGLPHDPFKALVGPRPIGWISTLDTEGRANLAPYSFFNAVSYNPCCVMFAASSLRDDPMKHSWRNVEETGEFVVNIVPYDLREKMNISSAHVGREVDEFELAKLEKAPSVKVKPPRVAAAPAHLECKHLQTVKMPCNKPDFQHGVIFGQVVGIHINDEVIVDGLVDVLKYRPLARLGYFDYTSVEHVFSIDRPDVLIRRSDEEEQRKTEVAE